MGLTLAKLIGIFIAIVFCFSIGYSSVEVFSNYDTVLKINTDKTIVVNKSLTLKNVYDVGIVPGQVEFKIGKGTEGSIGKIEIINAKAYDSFGNQIKTQVRQTSDYSVIILDVYYPLLPGFEYDFKLNYELAYEPGGIFFKSLQIPLRESTIPIESGEYKVVLPDNYKFTYLESEGGNGSIENNIASWNIKNDIPKSITFEYSYLPIPMFGNLQGSYLFWIGVNVLLLLFLIYEVRKEIKRFRVQYGE